MSMYHPKLVKFEERLKKLFDDVDHYIEDIYGEEYSIHPARPERGNTANPQADGLFNIGADFTAGYGSDRGRGYLIDVTMVTLERVAEDIRREIYTAAAEKVAELLPLHFPERRLEVVQDGNHFKILGDFSLGKL
jgi:hypothetical protein